MRKLKPRKVKSFAQGPSFVSGRARFHIRRDWLQSPSSSHRESAVCANRGNDGLSGPESYGLSTTVLHICLLSFRPSTNVCCAKQLESSREQTGLLTSWLQSPSGLSPLWVLFLGSSLYPKAKSAEPAGDRHPRQLTEERREPASHLHVETGAHPTKTWAVTFGVEGKGLSGRENNKADLSSQKRKEHKWTSLVVQGLKICLQHRGAWVRSLVWEDSTCRRATKPVSSNYWACEQQLLSLCALEPVFRSEKPLHN